MPLVVENAAHPRLPSVRGVDNHHFQELIMTPIEATQPPPPAPFPPGPDPDPPPPGPSDPIPSRPEPGEPIPPIPTPQPPLPDPSAGRQPPTRSHLQAEETLEPSDT